MPIRTIAAKAAQAAQAPAPAPAPVAEETIEVCYEVTGEDRYVTPPPGAVCAIQTKVCVTVPKPKEEPKPPPHITHPDRFCSPYPESIFDRRLSCHLER